MTWILRLPGCMGPVSCSKNVNNIHDIRICPLRLHPNPPPPPPPPPPLSKQRMIRN